MTQYTIYATAANSVGNIVTVNSVGNMFSGLPIVFSGNTFGNITAGATYYIGAVIPGYPTSTITLSSLPGGAVYAVSNATGNMTAVFSSGGQQIINTVPPGESLTDAFTAVNVNFDQLFAAGPVNSNIQIANNTVLTTNTNGNINLVPNGIGTVVINSSVIPDTANIRNLGSVNNRFSTIYAQYYNMSGNLTPENINTGNLTASGYISAVGNITGNYFFGNGSQLTGVVTSTGNIGFSGDAIYDLNGIYLENADLTQGATAAVVIPTNGSSDPIQVNNTYGNIALQTGAGSGITASWSFDNTGNLTLPSNSSSINYANGQPYGGSSAAAGNAGDIQINVAGNIGADSTLRYVDNGGEMTLYADYLNAPGVFTSDIYAGDGTPSNITLTTSYGNATWTFGTTGNLSIPGALNHYVVDNLANLAINSWTPIQLTTGDGVNTGYQNWTFDNAGELTLPSGGRLGFAGKGWTGLDGGNGNPVSVTSFYANGFYAGCVTNNPDGNVIINTYTGNGLQGNWTFDNTGNLTTSGNISAVGNITGAYLFGNGSQLTGVGAASVPSQNILPTIQSIIISNTSSEYETSGGSGYANVLVANVAPVIEYGVIVTAGSTVDKYVAGNLANIPGTEQITISTGTSDQPFTVYAYVTTNAGTYYSGPEVGFSGLCLLKGTMISLADGTYKPIEDINNGDLLLTWNFDLGQYAQARPLWIKRGESGTRYNKLTFSDGTTLRTFDQHRIFNKQAGAFTYPMSDDTPIGTVTVNEHGQEITLVKREIVWDTIEHYNIITDHHINLFADSVLTSCRFNNIYPITNMKFVKDNRRLRNHNEFVGIDQRWIDGLRLTEQTIALANIKQYIARLEHNEMSFSLSKNELKEIACQ